MAPLSRARKLAILVAPNVHVAITAAVTYHMLESHGGPMTFLEAALLTYKVSVVRNLIITVGVWAWAAAKPKYFPEKQKERAPGVLDTFEMIARMLLVNALCDALEDFVVIHFVGLAMPSASVAGALLNAAMFIPLSMAWEIVFDFGFYWAHRAVHAWPWLYWFAHKPHHKYQYPTVLAVHQQTLPDVLLNNFAPCVAAALLLPKGVEAAWNASLVRPSQFTPLQWHFVMAYKLLTEAAGHSSVRAPMSCFPQAVFLPNALKIDLHIIDHHWHHLAFTANYGKRFLLWDKVFGTYSTPENLQYHNDKKFQ